MLIKLSNNNNLMNKISYLILATTLLVSCNSNNEGTTYVTPSGTIIQKDFCYEIMAINEKGQPIANHYECMLYEATLGTDFQSAYEQLEPEISQLKEGLRVMYKDDNLWDVNRLEVRLMKCPVRNVPNSSWEYTRVNFFMYNIKPYDDYIMIQPYLIIDSEGNVYQPQWPE